MSNVVLPVKRRGWGQTMRRDAWWVQPLCVVLALSAFLAYANFRVFEGDHYYVHAGGAHYLTPFYSPLLFDQPGHTSGHAFWSAKPAWLGWLPSWISPAALILIVPAGFRFTCYYYRGAYYKAFWSDPPNCAVGEPRKSYLGENSLPLILQNVHRYFLYVSIFFLIALCVDVFHAMWFDDRQGTPRFGIGLGTLIMATNVALLWGYTLGCHSFRHLIGGGVDELSRQPLRMKLYDCSTCLNRRHMIWAWCSLVSVAFTDVYVRLCASGAWTDLRIL